jgi:hypothetical protein
MNLTELNFSFLFFQENMFRVNKILRQITQQAHVTVQACKRLIQKIHHVRNY